MGRKKVHLKKVEATKTKIRKFETSAKNKSKVTVTKPLVKTAFTENTILPDNVSELISSSNENQCSESVLSEGESMCDVSMNGKNKQRPLPDMSVLLTEEVIYSQ